VVRVGSTHKTVDSKRIFPIETQAPTPADPPTTVVLSEEMIDTDMAVQISRSYANRKIAIRTRNSKGSALRVYREEKNTLVEESFSEKFGAYLGICTISPKGDLIWGGRGFYSASTGNIISNVDRAAISGIEKPYGGSQYTWTDNEHVAEINFLNSSKSQGEDESERSIILWTTSETKIAKSIPSPNANAIAGSPDGLSLAEGGKDQRLRIRDAKTLKVTRELRVHNAPLIDIAWHPSLPYIATVGEDLRVRIWNLATEKMEEVLVEEIGLLREQPTQLLWSPDG